MIICKPGNARRIGELSKTGNAVHSEKNSPIDIVGKGYISNDDDDAISLRETVEGGGSEKGEDEGEDGEVENNDNPHES